MKNAIRCCISCILPCGALDMIRIVHSNGRVEEISGTIRAAEILKAHPNHVLKKRSSSRSDNGSEAMAPRIVVVPPDAELQRGKIYFLMPAAPLLQPSSPSDKRQSDSSTRKKRRERQASRNSSDNNKNNTKSATEPLVADQYLSEILKEKIWTQSERRRGRVGVWRPHLESILETLIEPTSDQSH
ncbi:hypothetical protein Nepgr_032216 [Nepenthes gracilis]|uniref:Uncharacterized protein n=1 Tax=Nepenthes gracilis TaxID=150966 RepID=A0AAD3Y5W0_NEPGR|nr:hypothetical protein Nepgr_032216 [Nepenthes gracilis]